MGGLITASLNVLIDKGSNSFDVFHFQNCLS